MEIGRRCPCRSVAGLHRAWTSLACCTSSNAGDSSTRISSRARRRLKRLSAEVQARRPWRRLTLGGLQMTAKDLTNQVVATYRMLRLGLAVLAFAFPLLLWTGGHLAGH